MSRPAVELAPPTAADIEALAAGMRDQDVAELQALGHTDLEHVVRACVDASAWCLAARVDGELACIFGVGSIGTLLAPVGSPWMLGTPLVARHRRFLASLAPDYIRLMLQQHGRLVNRVHAKNHVAIAWLKRVGFVLHDPAPVPPTGELFHTFEMNADGNC